MDGIEARAVVDGEVAVTTAEGAQHTVLIPAGVGLPGVEDERLAATVVVELQERGSALPAVLDVSQLLARDPGLLSAVAQRLGAG